MTLAELEAYRNASTRARAKMIAAREGVCAVCMSDNHTGKFDHEPEFWDKGYLWRFETQFLAARELADNAIARWIAERF